jgi:CheY-like chemotaxis protein
MHTVLVVEDDTAVRRTIARFLELDGFTAIEAGHGQAALEYLRNGGEASLIVLDLRMPLMDGWTFHREQRADPILARIPVIVLSAADVHDGVDAIATFRKPASMAALLSCIRRVCNHSKAMSELAARRPPAVQQLNVR